MNFKNKRKNILLFCVLFVFVLLGDVIYSPKLINADKPFIDLSGSVGTSVGNAQTAFAIANPTPTADTPDIESNYDYTIRISGEAVYLNSSLYSLSALNDDITGGKFRGKDILLLDDFAEVNTYKEILSALSNNNIIPVQGTKLFNGKII